MVGKSLSDLKDMGIKIPPADTNDKMVLLCFFNKQQRSSIYLIDELARMSDDLKQRGIIILLVEVSKIDENTMLNWGVQALPWMALTDKKNVVRVEGFTLNELNAMIKQLGGKKETIIAMQM